MTETSSASDLTANFLLEETDLPEVIESFVSTQVKEILEERQAELEQEIELEVQGCVAIAKTEIQAFSTSNTKLILDAMTKQTKILEYITEQQVLLSTSQTHLQNEVARLCDGIIHFDSCLDKLHAFFTQTQISYSSSVSETESETEIENFTSVLASVAARVPNQIICPPPSKPNQEPTAYGAPPKSMPSLPTLVSQLLLAVHPPSQGIKR